MKRLTIISFATLLAALIVGAVTAGVININIENGKIKATIEYAPTAASTEIIPGLSDIEYGQGEAKIDGEAIPTVESVDATGPQVNPEDEVPTDCPEGEECGRGAAYPSVDISSPQAFINATLGGCYDIDGYYNEQCWDYGALFFLNYAGHTLYTCGSGAAKGTIVDGCWQKNAGNEFTMVWDATKLQAGDWVVFDNGQFGHIGMAAGSYNNGYITLAGQNQGSGLCPGSTMGARVNIINISLKSFAGAFRPNIYIAPEPEPEPEPEPGPTPEPSKEIVFTYVKGDYFSKVLVDLGLDEGHLWGPEGAVAYYTEQLVAQNVLDVNGNVKIGVAFTLARR